MSKKILTINLTENTTEVKTFTDLEAYIGGVGLGLKLLELFDEQNPLIFTVGPLNGFIPFASKTCVVTRHDGVVEDFYLGGNLSYRIKFAGLDGILILGNSEKPVILDIQNSKVAFRDDTNKIENLGLPGKKSTLQFLDNKLVLNKYFTAHEDFLEQEFNKRNLIGIVITGTETFEVKDFEKYGKLYHDILDKKDLLLVDEGNYPSCSGCPMGCGKSKTGEIGGNILPHSLVACEYASKIFTDVGIVFSCLNVLGYSYRHEDLENLPSLLEETLKKLS